MRKKRRKEGIKIRRKWVINPRTRVKKSKKLYSRTREKEMLRKEDNNKIG
jgi:hypothetical protein